MAAIYINKIQYLSLTLPDWIMLNHHFIFALYNLFILTCHDFDINRMKRRWKTYHFDAICLRCQLIKPIREQNSFHKAYIPMISRLNFMEYVYQILNDVTAYSKSKQAVVNASDYFGTAYRNVIIFMKLTMICEYYLTF